MNSHPVLRRFIFTNELPGEGGVSQGRRLRCGHWTVPSPEGVEPRHERRVVLEAENVERLFVDFLERFPSQHRPELTLFCDTKCFSALFRSFSR